MARTISREALDLAYTCGHIALGDVIQRVFDSEKEIAALKKQIETLELAAKNSAPPHLANVETRKKV